MTFRPGAWPGSRGAEFTGRSGQQHDLGGGARVEPAVRFGDVGHRRHPRLPDPEVSHAISPPAPNPAPPDPPDRPHPRAPPAPRGPPDPTPRRHSAPPEAAARAP